MVHGETIVNPGGNAPESKTMTQLETEYFANSSAETIIEARGVSKIYKNFKALDSVSFSIPLGRIIGVIGSNGAGKTTLLNAILGLSDYDGALSVMGLDPMKQRDELMKDVCFISDVATLPKWMRVQQVLEFVAGVHDKFNMNKALDFIGRTNVPLDKKIGKLSKGMTVQVHLAIVMAIDAKLLVLDEPTLGLDIVFRKEFYKTLLEEYFDEDRTILITTHQVEEVEHILTDVMFVKAGKIVVNSDMESLQDMFTEVMVSAEQEEKALALKPITTGRSFGKLTCVYKDGNMNALKELGQTRRLGLADIFVATMKNRAF